MDLRLEEIPLAMSAGNAVMDVMFKKGFLS
jgi:hypothetical protein